MDPFASSTAANNGDENENTSVILDPLIVCGPSGVGKGTIIQKFMDELGGAKHFGFTVSHTTRQPRPGEIDGVHYHFVSSLDKMKRDIDDGLFLEHAQVHGNYYGTSWKAIQDVQLSGQDQRCLLDIDVQGVKRVKAMSSAMHQNASADDKNIMSSFKLQPRYLFIAPPSLEVLEQRLIGRGTETPEALARRTANARAEVEYGQKKGEFDAIVINEDLDQAVTDFADVVQKLYNY